jgi:DNA polymerase-3 subunit alpha
MPKFFPLHVHSHYSLLDGLSKPQQIAKRCEELELEGSALTDHGSLSGTVAFQNAMKKRGKKPILGCEFYISQEEPQKKSNRAMSHLVVLAKNLKGWRQLIKASSQANHPDFYYYKPRLDIENMARFADGNLIAFSGHMGSDLANILFDEPRFAYIASSVDEARKMLKPDWKRDAVRLAQKFESIFGKGNFFIEIQLIDQANLFASQVVAECLREVSTYTRIPPVATPDAHYASKEDALDQRVLLCNKLDITLREVNEKMVRNEDIDLGSFFKSSNYYIPSHDVMASLHTEEEIANSQLIADMCENYDITGKPRLPKYPCPDGMNSGEYLRKLCKEAWRGKQDLINQVCIKRGWTSAHYGSRFENEYTVLTEAGLADYFLIVNDIIQFARDDGQLVGAGRGSAGGSLILYLLGVTSVDPLEFDLLFERFYNAGRNTADRVSMPDVDMDFEKFGRERVLDYVRDRFGHDRVGQIITFHRMQGRSALKDVLRVHNACSADEMNRITEYIPDENDISDQLEIMREADKEAGGDGEASILQWTLENHPKEMQEWCFIDDKGKLQGPMAKMFAQAIRLEGTKRTQSRHAAGVILSNEPLNEVCPMVYDKSNNEWSVGYEMGDAEDCGHIKFDFLAIATLDKINMTQRQLAGEIE